MFDDTILPKVLAARDAMDAVAWVTRPGSQFKRTKLTVEPTAKAANVAVQTHPAGEEEGLIVKVLTEHAGQRILIAAHSNTVPLILKHLGHENDLKLEEHDYDNLFVMQLCGKAEPNVLRLHYGAASSQ